MNASEASVKSYKIFWKGENGTWKANLICIKLQDTKSRQKTLSNLSEFPHQIKNLKDAKSHTYMYIYKYQNQMNCKNVECALCNPSIHHTKTNRGSQ